MNDVHGDTDGTAGSRGDSLRHDVRNRLTVIKGVAQLLDRQIQRDEWQREKIVARVDRLQDEIALLERLVDDSE